MASFPLIHALCNGELPLVASLFTLCKEFKEIDYNEQLITQNFLKRKNLVFYKTFIYFFKI